MAPGQLGLLTVLPDLVAMWRIQSQLVSDIAAVYGKTANLGREHMLWCLFKHFRPMCTTLSRYCLCGLYRARIVDNDVPAFAGKQQSCGGANSGGGARDNADLGCVHDDYFKESQRWQVAALSQRTTQEQFCDCNLAGPVSGYLWQLVRHVLHARLVEDVCAWGRKYVLIGKICALHKSQLYKWRQAQKSDYGRPAGVAGRAPQSRRRAIFSESKGLLVR
jgi:hypothetical protein